MAWISALLRDSVRKRSPYPAARGGWSVKALSLALLPLLFVISPVTGATLPPGFTEELVATGLTDVTAMTFTPDGRLLVCQQGGELRVIRQGVLLPKPFTTVQADSRGEWGLLGVAVDPDFEKNQYIYVYYTATSPTTHHRVSRFTADGDLAAPGSEVVILDLPQVSSMIHAGGALHFGGDGKLYLGVGEDGNDLFSQSLDTPLGKILRFNPDGSIPTDNPFYEITKDINRAIWALGLRNPFTFAFHAGTGLMFINDVGGSFWEEINDGLAGANYGWGICEGPCDPPQPAFQDPIYAYPNTGDDCAITGGAFYNPALLQFPNEDVSDYFFADFCGGWIRRADLVTGLVTEFATGIAFPVDLQLGPDGNLYYLARGAGIDEGAVYRVQYVG